MQYFHTHVHTHVSDHTYGVVDGFREQGRSVREAGQNELHQHEGKVNVESDIAKHVDFSILNVSRGREDHFLEAACRGRGSSLQTQKQALLP